MTAIEFMQKQLEKHKLNLQRLVSRNAPEQDIRNVKLKISYYETVCNVLGGTYETDSM